MAKLKDRMSSEEFRQYLAKVEKGKTSLYKAIPTETADGQKFKSILESDYYNRCWVLMKSGEITKIEREIRYELVVNGILIAHYDMDFRITYATGIVEYVDCKSTATKTPLYMMKKKLMKALHDIELKEVFATDLR